jgi:hypothetical protein
MLKRGFIKPRISINNLGKRQFWTGIIIGVGAAFVLSYFFNYSREALRSITFMGDPFIISEKEFRLYDLFFAAFSTSLGFGFTIIYWLRGRNPNIKKRYLQTFTITNAWFITFVALMIVARFGSILPIVLYYMHGYDNHLNFLQEFWLLLIFIPIYVFFAQWNTIRLIFKTKNWILISIVLYCVTTFLLYKTTFADREILNQNYYLQNKERFDYIDKEIQKARKYDVFFSDSTNQVLQKRYAERITDLVLGLKHAFNKNKRVELDTLILEKIVIHNMNLQDVYMFRHRIEKDKNWSYVTPEEIYSQINKHDINSIETQVLFEILNEQASLFITKKIDWNKCSNYERERLNYKRYLLYSTETIQSRLTQVIELLKADKKFKKYHYLLLNLKSNDCRDKQKQKEIEILSANTFGK